MRTNRRTRPAKSSSACAIETLEDRRLFAAGLGKHVAPLADPVGGGGEMISVANSGDHQVTSPAAADADDGPTSAPKGVFAAPPGAPTHFATTATWTEREAVYDNEVGYFLTDANGTVNGVAPGSPGYAQAALTSQSRKILFASGSGPGATGTVAMTANDHLVFFIIQNNTTANFLSQNPSNTLGGGPLAFFSVTAANPDHYEHAQFTTSHAGNSAITTFRWEDLTNGGDEDFDDVVFTVSVVPSPSGQGNVNPNPNPNPGPGPDPNWNPLA